MMKKLLLALATCCLSLQIYAQPNSTKSASQIQMDLKKLTVLGSVLYIAAHPDDENTRLIAYMAKHECYETAYLALTRGDGGQNLIGSEQGELLGLIRTQELLAARSIDGGRQFFSRANDFGFSKNPNETLRIWDKNQVVADMVWVIRKWKPDVLITRFPTDGSGGHGHHTASALLAEEVFKYAADPTMFPEQLQYVTTWQPKRLYWNKWIRDGKDDLSKYLKVDTGIFNPLLGQSYFDLAMESRTQHKSQGFGSGKIRGKQPEYLQFIMGDSAKEHLMEGVNTTWSRIKGGEVVGSLLNEAYKNFSPLNPSLTLPRLISARREIANLLAKTNDPTEIYWLKTKNAELDEVIKNCAGIWFEITANDYTASPGDSVNATLRIINRSNAHVKLKKIDLSFDEESNQPEGSESKAVDYNLAENTLLEVNRKVILSRKSEISQPYWLRKPVIKGMYQVDEQELIGLPEKPQEQFVSIDLDIEGEVFSYTTPLMYKWTHRVDGELYRSFEVVPEVMANIKFPTYIFTENVSKEVAVTLKAGKKNASGTLSLDLPQGWRSEPQQVNFNLSKKDEELLVSFKVFPPKNASNATAKVKINGTDAVGIIRLEYDHIPYQVIFPRAEFKLVKLDVINKAKNVGFYVSEAGDETPNALRQLGCNVVEITDDNFEALDLSQFDAVVTGVRAYNTRQRLKYHNPKMLDYVKNGGVLIVQYNVNFGLVTNEIGPYPFKISRDRVTEEDALIAFNKENPLLNFPNKITKEDFDGWVQERGLYFASDWDSKYETPFITQDTGEQAKKGIQISAQYGKGIFIYTGFSWFRQLPAGVSGAYRLFANMISAGKK